MVNGIEPDDDIKLVARQSPTKCLLHSIAQRNDGKRDSTRLNARKICWGWMVGEKRFELLRKPRAFWKTSDKFHGASEDGEDSHEIRDRVH